MKLKLISLLALITIAPLIVYAQSQNLNLNDTSCFRIGPYCAYVRSLAMAPSNREVIYMGGDVSFTE